MDDRYLHELGQERERTAINRWLFGHAEEFFTALRLPLGWWCGVGLPRRELLGQDLDGDVDLFAGPLHLTISRSGWRGLLRDEARLRPGSSPSMLRGLALLRAGERGLVAWPPSVTSTVGIEVKASYFDGEKWKATHLGEAERIKGQIRVLHDSGVNSVNFLHLASTIPAGIPGSSWTPASAQVDLAIERGFPMPLAPDGKTGHFVALFGAVPEGTEDLNGVHHGLITIAKPKEAPSVSQPWHAALEERLSRLPRPRYLRTFIHCCSTCGRWRHAGSADPEGFPCTCSVPETGES